mmetsp:Transcript_6744/g.17722  ORF Transcript_6744/g.17722 Transcript_6744/m.17722 type:complete len:121 (-) Transcript_6744:127-489(-)
MKYADAIVKCFAGAIAIIGGTLLSVPLFGFVISRTFFLGVCCTVISSSLYAWAPRWHLDGLLGAGSPFKLQVGTELCAQRGHDSSESQPLVSSKEGDAGRGADDDADAEPAAALPETKKE